MAAYAFSRLRWRLWREMRTALPVLAAVPAVGFTLAAYIPETSAGWQIVRLLVAYPTGYLVPALAGILAAALARDDWDADAYAPSHLPLKTADLLAASFALPLAVAAALGLWTGWWSLLGKAIDPQGSGAPLFGGEALAYCCMWAVLTVACFATGYVGSAAATRQAGAIFPAMAANIGPTVLFNSRDALAAGRQEMPNTAVAWALVLGFAIAPIVATFAWTLTRRKLRVWRQYATLGAGLLTLALFSAPALLATWSRSFPGSGFPYFESDDGALIVQMTGQFGGPKGSGTYCRFADRRSGASDETLFPLFVQPLGFAGRSRAILAVRSPGEPRLSIRQWSLSDGSVREVVQIPYNARAAVGLETDNTYKGGFLAWTSPDGRWMLLRTRPSNGSGVDLWLVDIGRGEAKIVYANFETWGKSHVSWLGDRAILSGHPPQIAVDLPRGRAELFEPRWEGEQ